ncbi:MAG: hypothetical protein LUD41_05465 [Phascolarctobacterium sp.]|nr:hypothetical protein [Phascolarctobacterium sp.]
MGESAEKGTIKSKSTAGSGIDEVDKRNLDRKGDSVAEEEKSALVQQMPPDTGIRMGLVITELEFFDFALIAGGYF